MTMRIYKYFSKSLNLAILNGVLIAILIGFNIYYQAFCIPTTWTIVVLVICFTTTILYPILEKTKLAPLISFISGITTFIFIYCIIFLGGINFLGIIMFGLGVLLVLFLKLLKKTKLATFSSYIIGAIFLIFAVGIISIEGIELLGFVMIVIGIGLAAIIPFFIIFQLILKNIFKPIVKNYRYYFLLSTILCIGIVIYIGHDYKKAINSIEKFKESNYQELEKNFMTEKILGMHFIYHTELCGYDGWRPPKHDPALVIGMWLNNRHDPLDVDLGTRLELYQKFFPSYQYKFDCSCGIRYSSDYHNDKLWKQ